jgi:hypothetical protein
VAMTVDMAVADAESTINLPEEQKLGGLITIMQEPRLRLVTFRIKLAA